MPGEFYFPITVTSAGIIPAATRPTKPAGARLQAVFNALAAWEDDKTRQNSMDLQTAVSLWVHNDNDDFKKRDKLSNGLCKKLAIQCGQDQLRFKKIPTVAIFGDVNRNNHLVGQLRQPIVNPNPPPPNIYWFHRDPPNRVEVSRKSITAWMSILKNRGRNLAVILIDTQSVDHGVNVRWDGSKKVLNHMIEVLKKAEELELPVFEFWKSENLNTYNIKKQIRDGGTILDLRKILHKKKRRNRVYTLRKPSGNVFEGDVFEKRTGAEYVHPDDGVPGTAESAGQSFEQILAGLNQIHVFVVMGFDANMCVAASMFGAFQGAVPRTFVKGILDRGYNVITSRSLLASANTPLKADEGWPYMGPCQAV